MAKKKTRTSTALARPTIIREQTGPKAITIRVPAQKVAAPKKHHKKASNGNGAGGFEGVLWDVGGGYVAGKVVQSDFAATLPEAPVLGKLGTVALGMWAIGKYMHVPFLSRLSRGALGAAGYNASYDAKDAHHIAGFGPGVAAVMP